MTKAIFWDNDGVLVDTERLYFQATQQVLATIGITLTKAQFIDLFLVQGTGAWHLTAEKGFSLAEIEQLRSERNTLYATFLARDITVNDGVRDVLDALAGGYFMGIVTSSRREHFELIHQQTGLLPYFQFVLASGDYPRSKPHPDPYLAAVERSGYPKTACLVIEDSERGLAAAKEAGLRCIVVPNAFTRKSNFTGADMVLDRLTDLLSVL